MSTHQFKIGQIRHIEQGSKEIGSTRVYKTGVRSVQVECSCGHAWTADERNGLRNVMGGVQIDCPSCHKGSHVAAKDVGL